jgi:NADH:ubiquinone oxidoreductase subunit E
MSHIKIELRKEDSDFIKGVCESYKNDPQELINVLHSCQEHFGYLPAEIQEVVAEELNIPVARVYGVVTFYSFFTMVPKGRHPISICLGTACYVRGAEKVLDEFKNSWASRWVNVQKTINFRCQVSDVLEHADLHLLCLWAIKHMAGFLLMK